MPPVAIIGIAHLHFYGPLFPFSICRSGIPKALGSLLLTGVPATLRYNNLNVMSDNECVE